MPGVDNDLLMYFSNMTDEEIMGEYQMVMMQMMEDPEIAEAFQYLAAHPNDMMGALSDPTVANGVRKMAENPLFCTLQHLINGRMH